jgi:NADP-dependent 3-hydroxy acid dehydrogenase YdfG
VVAAPGDVGTASVCEAIVAAAIEGLGGLDVLVNNAGIGLDARIEDTDEAFWDATLDINLKGTFFCSRAALEALRATRGNIINISSDAGLVGSQTLVAYCASKSSRRWCASTASAPATSTPTWFGATASTRQTIRPPKSRRSSTSRLSNAWPRPKRSLRSSSSWPHTKPDS